MDTATARTNLLGLTRDELEAFVTDMGEKPFRARQLMKWIYRRGVADIGAMTDLGKGFRERLSAVLGFGQDSAGGLMNLDAVTIRPDVTLEVVMRYLRMRAELPDRTDRLFVVSTDESGNTRLTPVTAQL